MLFPGSAFSSIKQVSGVIPHASQSTSDDFAVA